MCCLKLFWKSRTDLINLIKIIIIQLLYFSMKSDLKVKRKPNSEVASFKNNRRLLKAKTFKILKIKQWEVHRKKFKILLQKLDIKWKNWTNKLLSKIKSTEINWIILIKPIFFNKDLKKIIKVYKILKKRSTISGTKKIVC